VGLKNHGKLMTSKHKSEPIKKLLVGLQIGEKTETCYIFGTKKHGLSKNFTGRNLILLGVTDTDLFTDTKNKLASKDIDELKKIKAFLEKETQQTIQPPGRNELKIMLKAIIELIEEKKTTATRL
jgi:hypothetical protein